MRYSPGRTIIPLVLSAVLAWVAGCSQQPERSVVELDSRAVHDVFETLLVGSEGLALSTDPSIIVTDPTDGQYFIQQPAATPITISFTVFNWVFPSSDHRIRVYVDNLLLDPSAGEVVFQADNLTISDLAFGQHIISLVLTQDGGSGPVELANAEARANVMVRVKKECETYDNAACDDGNPCSVEACVSEQGNGSWCHYGNPIGIECCITDYECDPGWVCLENSCRQCWQDDQCNDGDVCTTDSCSGGLCLHEAVPDCCNQDEDCDDGLHCTVDICQNPNTCVFQPGGDPNCCEGDWGCDDLDPCTVDKCVSYQCRHGAVLNQDCCRDEGDCDDGNPCTIDACDTLSNECTHQPDPSMTECCELNSDCDDGDPSTLDWCSQHLCVYTGNPNFCDETGDNPCLDDGNPCTVEACTDNTCLHTVQPGCCVISADCDDRDACTLDSCQLTGDTGICSFIPKVDCCNSDAECVDDNPCDVEACVNHVCRQGVNLQFLDCCQVEADCEDECACTQDSCGTDHTCVHALPEPQDGCCFTSLDCDDGDPLTVDKCIGCQCVHQDDPIHCDELHLTCDDLNPCTYDYCSLDAEPFVCNHEIKPDCCLAHSDCDDGQQCTQDICDPGQHKCVYWPVDDCCGADAECDDANPCTQDACVAKRCRHTTSIKDCCQTVSDCIQDNPCLLPACSGVTHQCTYTINPAHPTLTCCMGDQDCWDGLLCTDDVCTNYQCQNPPLSNCCTPENAAVMCDDHNACTWDACVLGRCRNLPADVAPPDADIPATCCYSDSECPEDGNPCTHEACVGGQCTHQLLDPCVLPLPYTQTFAGCTTLASIGWSVTDLGAVSSTSNWACATEGALGPDRFALFSSEPFTGEIFSYLTSPMISMAGQTSATLQLSLWLDDFEGLEELGVYLSDGGMASAVPLWTLVPDGDLEPFVLHLPVLPGYMGDAVRFGISVSGPTSYNLDFFGVDDFKVCPGHAPEFESPPASLGVTWAQVSTTVLSARDSDTGTLTFSLLSAPSFVKLQNYRSGGDVHQHLIDLVVDPTGPQDAGEHQIRLRVSDGCLTSIIEVELTVLIEGGYAVWAPSEVPEEHGAALVAAIQASGRQAQLVRDLLVFPDLTRLDGIVGALGIYGRKHVLSGPEVTALATYLLDGGRLYLEGGDVWARDPFTTLQSLMGTKGGADGTRTMVGPLVGKLFIKGQNHNLKTSPFLNNFLDQIHPVPEAMIFQRFEGVIPFVTSVGHQDTATGYRTIASSVPLAALTTPSDSSVTMGMYLDYLEGGVPPCLDDSWCDDSLPCTTDTCDSGGICVHSEVPGCVACEDDQVCPVDEACLPSGVCQPIPGTAHYSEDTPKTIGTSHTQPVSVLSTIEVGDGGEVKDLQVKVALSHAYRGDLRITLSHGATSLVLQNPVPQDNGTGYYLTWDLGASPSGAGGMSVFNGAPAAGIWSLLVEDTSPALSGGELEGWSVHIQTETLCTADYECDDSNLCTDDTCFLNWCRHDPTDCRDFSDGHPNLCTTDTCGPSQGCIHTAVSCSDGDLCTLDSCLSLTGECTFSRLDHCIKTCSGHQDCGLDDYCDPVTSSCKPIPGQTWTVADEQALPIPDSQPVPLSLPMVVTQGGLVVDAYVKVWIEHPYVGDLDLTLARGGRTLVLHDRTGGSQDNLYRVYDLDVPDGPGDMELFSGLAAAGTWTLSVRDHAVGDSGTLERWRIYLVTAECADAGDCDDQNLCTTDDCVDDSGSRLCRHEAVVCTDGLFCNGEETCAPTLGCVAGPAPAVDDGISCTADFCDETLDQITHIPSDRACDDGEWCNGAETCDALTGCASDPPPGLDDGVDCTLDLCDEDVGQIIHLPSNAACDDGDWCNGVETCNSTLGCLSGTAPTADDGIACTEETCDPVLKTILHVVRDELCDDGVFCNGPEVCSPVTGCVIGVPPYPVDGVDCTLDACDETLDALTHVPQDSLCDDDNPCTSDSCNPTLGCVHSNLTVACDDGDQCTDGDQCSGGECVPGAGIPAGCTCVVAADCPVDGDLCNGDYLCTAGVCRRDPATVVDCGEATAGGCVIPACDPLTGLCVADQAPAGTACDDGDLCTVGGTCDGLGTCMETPRVCDDGLFCNGVETCDSLVGCRPGVAPTLDDGVTCTADFCDEAGDQVLHTPGDQFCQDGQFCNGREVCDPILGCRAGAVPATDDGVVCTQDTCDEDLDTVTHTPRSSMCGDGQFCNGQEVCDPVDDCIPGTAPVVDDGLACTLDSCDEAQDKVVHVPTHALCDDGDSCNGVERCDPASGCIAILVPLIDDGVECTVDACDPSTGLVTHTPDDGLCDNGDYCDGLETCDSLLGCRDGAALLIDDGLLCTVDSCDPATGLVLHAPDNDWCSAHADDGNICTAEVCDPVAGCLNQPLTHGVDGSFYCQAECSNWAVCMAGECIGQDHDYDACPPCDEDLDCLFYNDSDPCNGWLVCDSGLCGIDPLSPVNCDSSGDTPCSVNTCSPESGFGCAMTDLPAGTECEDGDLCTTATLCDGSGTCGGGTPRVCDDGLWCNGTETCDPASGCLAGVVPALSDGVDCTADLCDEELEQVVHLPRDSFCDDGLWCNGVETCDPVFGCVPGPVPVVDDGLICTLDACDEVTRTVVHTPDDALCDDGLWCNGPELCVPGLGCASGSTDFLDDGQDCTLDVCDEDLDAVLHVPFHSLCDDGNQCNGAELCDPSLGCVAGSPVDVDDGISCTVDSCDQDAGVVIHSPNSGLCSDGIWCNGQETCTPGLGCVSNPVEGLDDGVACTLDFCEETWHVTTHTGDDSQCDDLAWCNGVEFCDSLAGCQDAAAPRVSDGVFCTLDSCDEASDQVVNLADSTLCDDSNPCTLDTCDPASGCIHVNQAVACDDGDVCTINDQCVDGDCVGGGVSPEAGCVCFVASDCPDDGDPCNGVYNCVGAFCVLDPTSVVSCPDTGNVCTTNLCNPATGTCQLGFAAVGTTCDDGNPCTLDETCNGAGLCTSGTSACSDGLFCNGSETCNVTTGACSPGVAPTLDDGVDCTLDFCDEGTDSVVHRAWDAQCDDDLFCNGQEICDTSLGCLAGPPVLLTDGIPCTLDYCDEGLDQVLHITRDNLCDDGLWCNGIETCHGVNGCVSGAAPESDDGVDCTLETCDEALDAIVHQPDHAGCQDGDLCNGQEFCDPALGCRDGAPPVVDDGVSCTIDSCDPVLGVLHSADDSQCDDGLFCNGLEFCDPELGCVSQAGPLLSDGVACTLDFCDETLDQVRHVAQDSGCDDGQLCNGRETCDPVLGCITGAVDSCDDGDPCTRNLCDPLAESGTGACDNSQREDHCTAACGGAHPFDAGDDQCGLLDACIGGTAGADQGLCEPICRGEDCVALSGAGFSIPDGGCEYSEVVLEEEGLFVQTMSVKMAVHHQWLADLSLAIQSPDGDWIQLWDGFGSPYEDFHNTFDLSFGEIPDSVCEMQGDPASGIWTLRVCDSSPGVVGAVDSWSLHLSATDTAEALGNTCETAVVIEPIGTQVLHGETTCAQPFYAGTCGGILGRDRVYRFTLEQATRLVASSSSDTFDQIIYLKSGNESTCDEVSLVCQDSCAGQSCSEEIDRWLEPGIWYLFVDGAGGQDGIYSLEVSFSTQGERGDPCDSNADCLSAHCSNGFCCDAGVCCGVADDCPASFTLASICFAPEQCQGERGQAGCVDNACVTTQVPDDSGCEGNLSLRCGNFQDIYCTSASVQPIPICPGFCTLDGDCDPAYHCDSGFCAADFPNGTPCTAGAQCLSDHCSNGYCCLYGDCCAVVGDCIAAGWESPAVCDSPGDCQGHRSDAFCWNSVCGSSIYSDDSACDGTVLASECGLYPSVYCDGQVDQGPPPCAESCVLDEDCDPEAHCDDTCIIDLADGQGCDENSDCQSDHCANGFCCTAGDCCILAEDCPGSYAAPAVCDLAGDCQGHREDAACVSHSCTTVGVADDSACDTLTLADQCGYYPSVYCTGAADQVDPMCSSSCVVDGDCDPIAHCFGGICAEDKPDGWDCTLDSECASGHCSNGFCCSSGTCCSVAADCPPEFTIGSVCDDAATCQGHRVEPACSGFICAGVSVGDDTGCASDLEASDCGSYLPVLCSGLESQSAPACPVACTLDSECDPDAHCDDTCQPDLADGEACDEAGDCLSDNCIDSVCCNTACAGLCESCALAGSIGTCTLISDNNDPQAECGLCGVCDGLGGCRLAADGEDPKDQCSEFAASTCLQDGWCDGAGACRLWALGTICDPTHCALAVAHDDGLCDGAGTCDPGSTSPCDPYTCDGDQLACLTSCTVDSECTGGWFCVGAVCVEKKPLAEPCAADGECLSNFCADGVCCNSACTGECESCALEASVGTCSMISVNTDPDLECGTCRVCDGTGSCKDVPEGLDYLTQCEASDPSTCGLEGTCDGAGACAFWSSGTWCAPISCAEGVQTNPDTCDGSGTCVDNGTTDCRPYLCNGDVECYGSCSDDSQCTSDAWCDSGACQLGRLDGMTCSQGSECLSSFCVDGFCCNQACDGDCRSCALVPGTCTGHPADTDPELDCGACEACDGGGACGPASAGTDPHGDCSSTSQTTCGLDGSCDGASACRLWLPGTLCSPQFCLGDQVYAPDLCDGSGTCLDSGITPCEPYLCNDSGTDCFHTCEDHGDCHADYWCDEGSCEPKRAAGEACGIPEACQSDFCVDGVCCDGACAGNCESCSINPGVCTFIGADQDPDDDCPLCRVCDGVGGCGMAADGTDPVDDCSDEGAFTCGLDGSCDGGGACRFYPVGEICLPSFCADSTFNNPDLCSGPGTCGDGGQVSCEPYRCTGDGAACRTTCSLHSDCFMGYHCNAGTCELGIWQGEPCDLSSQCLTGQCVDGLCCDTACDGPCKSCNQPGLEGTCSPHANGSDPEEDCGECRVCSGAGFCRNVASGLDPKDECEPEDPSTCGLDGDCSGLGACGLWTTGTQCHASSCTDGQELTTGYCDGSGLCQDSGIKDCDGYTCTDDGSRCRYTCYADGECLPDFWCNSFHQCVAKSANGEACTLDARCISGNCVDGVCCNTECSGLCASCGLAGSEGTCTPIPVGTDPEAECGFCLACDGAFACGPAADGLDPKDECAAAPVASCGQDGDCDGAGACGLWSSGTMCLAQTCLGETLYPPDYCDGTGTCADAGSSSCGLYACNAAGDACRTMCLSDSNCSSIAFCQLTVCVEKYADGATCTQDSQCASDSCVDGYCCNVPCDSGCESCALVPGVCTPEPPGQDPTHDCPACQVCDGIGGCGFAGDGDDPKDDCTQFSRSTCGTDGACDGAGSCRLWASGTVCMSGYCFSGAMFQEDTCDGAGLCQDGGITECLPYECLGDGSGCLGSCAGDGDCMPGYWCDASVCIPQTDQGLACSESRECISGFCVDGLCCDSECSGECQTCNQGGSEGICTYFANNSDPDDECTTCRVCNGAGSCRNVLEGLDPESDCEAEGADTCGLDGTCDGTGDCRLWIWTTVCAAQSCTGSVRQNADYCDGEGLCLDLGTRDCAPYVCHSAGLDCRYSCYDDTHCVADAYCSGSACLQKKADGLACGTDRECLTGRCSAGICCGTCPP